MIVLDTHTLGDNIFQEFQDVFVASKTVCDFCLNLVDDFKEPPKYSFELPVSMLYGLNKEEEDGWMNFFCHV